MTNGFCSFFLTILMGYFKFVLCFVLIAYNTRGYNVYISYTNYYFFILQIMDGLMKNIAVDLDVGTIANFAALSADSNISEVGKEIQYILESS